MPTASVQAQRFKVLLAGVFSQILCIGIARFAYTPLLPVMLVSQIANTWFVNKESINCLQLVID